MPRKSFFTFPACLGLVVIAIEAFLSWLIWRSAPPGTHWLGGTIQNTSDTAIYFSYIAQAASHGLTFINPFASEMQTPRFDLVWSSLGLLARTGLSPLLVYELARWIFTLVLAFAVFLTARSVAQTERDAKLGALLSFLGIGTGALYVAWTGMTHTWMNHAFVGPDITSEFAIAPMTIGGPHILLSIALLVLSLRFIWNACAEPKSRAVWYATLSLTALFCFHPYYVALIAVFYPVCVIANHLYRAPTLLLKKTAILSLSCVGLIAILPLLHDQVFFGVHNVANILPLGPWYVWLITLFPFIVAIIWRWHHKITLRPQERWIVAWLVTVLLSLLLPISWKRKLTEGAQIGLVLLTLPAWVALRDWLMTLRLRVLLVPLALMAAGFAPLQILLSQCAWISRADRLHWFYATDAIFDGFAELRRNSSPTAVITTDDRWLNFWVPAYTLRNSWIGHDHATTHFEEKTAAWLELMQTTNSVRANEILTRAGVTDILATHPGSINRLSALLEPEGWQIVWREGANTALFTRTRRLPLPELPST